ncbi:MAG: HAMP domain-containing histidine kinase [Gemmatimonadaceae bacterium]|jgi:signal transduction histidine kinase|nr:HAMP domain-containing histidine kinase [Gemmatimonadaceae bacterium]
MRRPRPVLLVAIGVALLLGWYVLYTQQLVRELRRDAAQAGQMYSRVYQALTDTSESPEAAAGALLDLARNIRETGVPLILTDRDGRVAAVANLPFDEPLSGAQTQAYVATLDKLNAPIVEPGIGAVHYGDSPVVRGLRVIPWLQASALVLLLLAGVYALRERGRADREAVWAGMARESAHQLGTPLSSLSGWIELLRDRDDGAASDTLDRMAQDVERLERVSHRFERIGRPPRRDEVALDQLVDRMADYFARRAPTLTRKVLVRAEHPAGGIRIKGDAVLLEWVVEALVKNAIDALGGRGGEVVIEAAALAEGGARLRVRDDGPGIPAAMRKRIFDAGFTTKERGWGIGLALARRIVEENHGGSLTLVPSAKGAVFDVILPA